jgi:hypothetical protein
MSILTHSQETRDRMKANAEAAKKRLARLNQEHQVREKMREIAKTKAKSKQESFGEAVARIARENQVTI